MAVKLVVLCAVLSVNWEVSGSRVNILETKYTSSGRHFINAQNNVINAQNNVTLCDYQKLAKAYTLCSVPFYADYIGDTLKSQELSCSPVEKFQACLASALEETRCVNDTALLTHTIKYFTRSVLHPYEKMCNITSEIPNLTPVAEITLVSANKNQTSLRNETSTKSNAAADPSKKSSVEKNQTGALLPEKKSSHQTRAPPSDQTSKRAFKEDTPALGRNSGTVGKNITSGAADAPNATKNIPAAGANVSSSGGSLKKNLVDDNCDTIDKTFKYPDTCVKNWLLRRMFTCGVSMFEFILHNQSAQCQCIMNYRKCIENAIVELNCTTTEKNDPIMVTVKLIESLMLAWYKNPCVIYKKDSRGRERASGITSDVCDASTASAASVVCYATYFAMSELKTPAPWTSHNDACSAFNDVQRCLLVAEHKNNCTQVEFTQHSRRFLAAITSGKHRHCPVDAGFPKSQALGAYAKPGCQRSKALRRALQCALSFQDFADTEREFLPPQPVPCGHVSRLHTCLEDSVEGTGCYGDISVHSEIKVYKKVLEDVYDVRCLVEAPPEMEAGARGLQRMLSPSEKGGYKHASGSSELRNWRIDLGLYDKSAENVGYYYDESVDGHKQVFAGPRVVAMHPDDMDEETDYALYQKAPYSASSGWRPLAQKLQDKPAAPAALAEEVANGSKNSLPDSTPHFLMNFFRPNLSRAAAVEVSTNRSANFLRVEEPKDPKKAPSKPNDDYIFARDYLENSGLAMFPNGMDMFRHFRGGALARVDSVIAPNKSAEFNFFGTNDCPFDKVRLALRLCNSTLSGLLVRWPNITDIGLPLDTSSAGVKDFCSDLNTYRGCLVSVLKSYNCHYSQAINGVFEAYRKKLRLPHCASSASWNRAAVYTVFVALLITLVEKHM